MPNDTQAPSASAHVAHFVRQHVEPDPADGKHALPLRHAWGKS